MVCDIREQERQDNRNNDVDVEMKENGKKICINRAKYVE